MHTITKVIKNLKNYGNCKIYIPINDKTDSSIEFLINEDGVLNFRVYKNTYCSLSYWNGEEKNEDFKLESSDCLLDSENKYFNFIMSYLICDVFSEENLLVEEDETQICKNSTPAVERVYNTVNNMLDLKEEQYADIVTMGEMKMVSILIYNVSSKSKTKQVPKFIDMAVELKMRNFDASLYKYKYLWELMYHSRTDDESKEAKKEWELLLTKNS